MFLESILQVEPPIS